MNHDSERSIFLEAIDLPPDARIAFLNQACGTDAALRSAVEQLLSSHESMDNPLDEPQAELVIDKALFDELVNKPVPVNHDLAGTRIGNYKLMELIGEGGFGLVYVAEQQQPVRRRVALKIIKPGMDSREVIARFEAERQALAMMDHPNIARVFDAGVSDDQRLYFVMELVRGIPITGFCDLQRLTLRSRSELFCDVCAAIQHAHQKGIIHRDIKPSNVLVTLHDAKPVVKVIDFGVAKAIGQRLTDKTIYTRFFAMIGTPVYMSPEQAEMSGLDIDTRSDIYSLGVLLYELLTGTTPFERERLDSVGYDEMRRIIREEEPVKPSNRITTLGESLTAVSHSRNAEPRKLTGLVAGDLDWIVLKALDKDRNRRYETATGFADDLKRFLNEEPIRARPPSKVYQLRKYYRRNRLALLSGAAIVTALIAGTFVSLWQATQAITERNEKQEALQMALLATQEATTARLEVEQFAERLKQANVLMTRGQTYADARQWEAAHADFTEAISLQPKYYLVWIQRAQLYAKLYCRDEAAADYEQATSLGAAADEPAWWGTPQLFWFTGRQDMYQSIMQNILTKQNADVPHSWYAIRSALIAPTPGISFAELADEAESKLAGHRRNNRMDGAPPIGRPPRDGNPPDRPRPGPGGGNDRMENGGGPPPRPSGPNGERSDDWLPRGAQYYVAGWANLRAGRLDRAIELLQRAPEEDRGWPGKDFIHFPMAIALHKSGKVELARESLDRGKQAISELLESAASQSGDVIPGPWFDLVESELLYREASILVTGNPPPTNPEMERVREQSLELLGR